MRKWTDRTRGTVMVVMEDVGKYPLSLATGSLSDYFIEAYKIMKVKRISIEEIRKDWEVESFSTSEEEAVLTVKRKI